MELEDMKKSWNELTNKRIEALESQNDALIDKLRKQRATTLKDKLERRFRILTAVCLLAPTLINHSFFQAEEFAVIGWYFPLFFLIMATLQARTWWLFSRIDYTRMTIKEAVKSVYETERWIRHHQLIGIGLALPLLVLLFYQFYQMQIFEAIYGAWVGLMIGGCVGWRIQRNIKRDLQHIKEELGEA